MKTLHGVHVHGFPNAFIVQPTQGANLISNVPHNLTDTARTIARVVSHALESGAKEVEVTAEAETKWVDLLLSGPGRMIGSQECTPGYYNNEGQDPGPEAKYYVGYPAGASAYFRYIENWRQSGAFEGWPSAEAEGSGRGTTDENCNRRALPVARRRNGRCCADNARGPARLFACNA